MRFCVLGSGSKGNSTYIEKGRTRVLIDAGFSGIEIQRRLAAIGVDAAQLSAIVVTHEHSDHIRGVAVLSRKFDLPVFANAATFKAAGKSLGNLAAAKEFMTGASFSLQDLIVHPFAVSHDAADPVGFMVSDGVRSMGYCTDTGIVSRLMRHRLGSCNGLVLECNHDPAMLKNGPYPPALKQRVRSKNGHLANGDAADFIINILHDGLEHVVLSHISETNNHPDLAHETVMSLLLELARREPGPRQLPAVSVALQDGVGEVVTLKGGAR